MTLAPSLASPETTRKKRSIAVKLAAPPPKPTRTYLVARKARKGEAIDKNNLANVTSPGKARGVRRLPYGGVVARTVIGSTERFEEHEAAAA